MAREMGSMLKIGVTTAFLQNLHAGTWVYLNSLLAAYDELAEVDGNLFTVDLSAASVKGLQRIPHVTYASASGKLSKVIWPNLILPGKAAGDGFDLIHTTTHYGTFVPCKYRNVITVTDVSPLLHPETHGRMQVAYHRHILPAVLKRADAVVTISNSSKSDIVAACNIPDKKVHVVHLGVDARFSPAATSASDFANTLPERYILNIGTLEARKNLPRLLEAYAIARRKGLDRKFLIGGARGWRLSNLANIVEKYSLENDVQFLGFVDDADLPVLYGRADFFIYPSLYEGFGMPILEAMACGTPVITSNCSSMPEVAGNAALLVEPHDVNDMASKMMELAGSKDLCTGLRSAGLARAAEFTWNETARRTMAVYRMAA